MKTLLLILTSFTLSFTTPLDAITASGPDSLSVLQKEVVRLFGKHEIDSPDIPGHKVTVGFMINARNELIVVEVEGDSAPACEFVREVLNYKKVKFNQSKQLTRYTIKIELR